MGEATAGRQAAPSLRGEPVPLMGEEEEEDRNLLLAATGQRGGEGKLMASWVDKGEDEG